MRRLFSLVALVGPLSGCKPELPSLDYRGERVMMGSDRVGQVCGGTLNRMDEEVEQIEARLDIPRQASRLNVYVVDAETVDSYCAGAAGCTIRPSRGAPFVVVDHQNFEWAITHELVHARLAASRSVPLFDEGVAVALSSPSCPRPTPDFDLSEVLASKESEDFIEVTGGHFGGYYVAGELVAWLLDEFDPGLVISLLRSVDKRASPSTTRAEYLKHFDRELDLDILAHLRTQADLDVLPPEYFGCLAAAIDPSRGPLHLVADLDCDSDRVHNDFGVGEGGYVEWMLHLDHEQTLEIEGEVPFGTSLTIEVCGCVPEQGKDEYLLARPFDARQRLGPGSYRLRWVGALDEGLALDVELVALEG